MSEHHLVKDFSEQIVHVIDSKKKLFIRGGRSKAFLVDASCDASVLNTSDYCGIIDYEPSELVITVRAGTRLQSVESMLSSRGQRFAFEPPAYDNNTTIGGMVACGLSGSARPYSGAVRDAVLGVKMLNGKGEILKFGGQVIKNVAGYDLSRLMTGSFGTLGVILEVSLKVLPIPQAQSTIAIKADRKSILNSLHQLHLTIPNITGLAASEEEIYCRVSGGKTVVKQTVDSLPGQILKSGETFWKSLRNHQLDFFKDDKPLWRVSLPPAAEPLKIDVESMVDWGGALRWLKTEQTPTKIIKSAESSGGSAYQFHAGSGDRLPLFYLSGGMAAIHKQLKHSFDPHDVFDTQTLYSEVY